MRAVLRKSKAILGLRDDLQKLQNVYLSGQKRSIDRYLASATRPALHIGAYKSHIPGWLDTDIKPVDAQTVYLDATVPIPVPAATFDYIFAEHMIEHVPFAAGAAMLKECRRVLKPGGALRIATPDLAFILGLYSNPGEQGERYIRWIASRFLSERPEAAVDATAVINNAFRAWGHQYLYDEPSLRATLQAAGLPDVKRCMYNESEHAMLRGIETHGIIADNIDMAILETMILEASYSV